MYQMTTLISTEEIGKLKEKYEARVKVDGGLADKAKEHFNKFDGELVGILFERMGKVVKTDIPVLFQKPDVHYKNNLYRNPGYLNHVCGSIVEHLSNIKEKDKGATKTAKNIKGYIDELTHDVRSDVSSASYSDSSRDIGLIKGICSLYVQPIKTEVDDIVKKDRASNDFKDDFSFMSGIFDNMLGRMIRNDAYKVINIAMLSILDKFTSEYVDEHYNKGVERKIIMNMYATAFVIHHIAAHHKSTRQNKQKHTPKKLAKLSMVLNEYFKD